jgi:hypothetical protein
VDAKEPQLQARAPGTNYSNLIYGDDHVLKKLFGSKKILALTTVAMLAIAAIAMPVFAGTWAAPDNPTEGSDTIPVYYLFYQSGVDDDGNPIIIPVPHGQGIVKGYDNDNALLNTKTFYFQHTTVYYTDAYVTSIKVGGVEKYVDNNPDPDDPSGNGKATFALNSFVSTPVTINGVTTNILATSAVFTLNTQHTGQTYYLAKVPQ